MVFTLTDEQGACLAKLARRAIESPSKDFDDTDDPVLRENCGVFITLTINDSLRGCIGLPYPTTPLHDAVIQAARSAAYEDPRFPPVNKSEINNIIIEVSVLTSPELIEVPPSELPDSILVGRDGLIIERGWNKGLLLPQVPVEWGWDSEQFLSQCCVKAGLPPNAWKQQGTKIYTFQAILFKEETPSGKINRHRLSEE